jgi:nicotinamidase-related amidase
MKSALVIVDMLNDFLSGPLKTQEAMKTIEPVKTVLDKFRSHKLPVIYVNDHHYPDDFEIRIWGQHAMAGTDGSKIFEAISPKEKEYVIEKHTYSGFYGTPLDYILRSNKVEAVVLVGLDADICVRHTAADAFYRGYSIFIVRDAVAARIDPSWEKYFVKVYGARIINSSEIEAILKVNER